MQEFVFIKGNYYGNNSNDDDFCIVVDLIVGNGGQSRVVKNIVDDIEIGNSVQVENDDDRD